MKTKKKIKRLVASVEVHKHHILILEAKLRELTKTVNNHGCSKVQH
jgi:hypothetical protein